METKLTSSIETMSIEDVKSFQTVLKVDEEILMIASKMRKCNMIKSELFVSQCGNFIPPSDVEDMTGITLLQIKKEVLDPILKALEAKTNAIMNRSIGVSEVAKCFMKFKNVQEIEIELQTLCSFFYIDNSRKQSIEKTAQTINSVFLLGKCINSSNKLLKMIQDFNLNGDFTVLTNISEKVGRLISEYYLFGDTHTTKRK